MSEAFLSLRAGCEVVYINARGETLLGLDREEVLETSLWDALPSFRGGALHDAVQSRRDCEVDQFHAPSGRWLGLRLVPGEDLLHLYFEDVTDKKRAKEAREQVHVNLQDQMRTHTDKLERLNEKLLYDSLHDALTGLPNRTHLIDTLRRALTSYQTHAVLFLDFDGFKLINDSLGHTVGDELLIALARRLKNEMRPTELVARLGGDEFTVLIPGVESLEQVLGIVNRLQASLTQPFRVHDYSLHVSASIGVVYDIRAYATAEEVLRDADIAMYRAKNAGKGQHAVFDSALHAEVMNRMTLESDLRFAVERGELLVHYQPIVALSSLQPSGFETLVRWNHPTRGFLPPGEFVPIAEDTGLITALDMWVVQEACGQLKRWGAASPSAEQLELSVNFSGRHFATVDLYGQLHAIFGAADFAPERLNIEITETVLMNDTTHTQLTLAKLCEAGINLHIDDFGTGYSSLSYLQRFKADGLKIDRSFVMRLDDPKGAELVRSLIAMAHSLDMKVTAEGVETSQQLTCLRNLGCDYAQGYYLSKPLPAQEAYAYLSQSRGMVAA